MNYVILSCLDYEGCQYEAAFSLLEEAIAYIGKPKYPMGGYYEIWDTSTNTKVKEVDGHR